MPRRLALLPLLLLLAPRPSHADLTDNFKPGTYISVGPLVSVSMLGDEPVAGLGLEATLNHYSESGGTPSAVGLFTQLQTMGGKSARFSGGVQANLYIVGLELGVMHITGTPKYLPTTGLHVAPYVSVGFCSMALRFGIPLSNEESNREGLVRHPTEVGLVLTAKWPFRQGY
ncbi:hypothetical protein [Myxococcus landrumensis]|uniref:Outer membrane protein beta-barrel domain-containing protein n=1 Tax=Myxococcus landrumensis TaxID=2813577 RepID=A0ABX7N3R8_9BACT|nr:hypothetical protein [Myxococcus landrumus]QSQ13138.1 hypothetical protein JY572_33085 [Myxococcus landrumus]